MFRFALAFAIAAAAASAGPACVAGGSLASYEALGAAGCVIDPAIPLNVGSFSYSVLADSSPAVVTPATDIFVTPVLLGAGHPGLEFTSGTFDVTGAEFVDYLIGFTWDPPDIRSADDILNDPVVPPGLAKLTTALCLGAGFTGVTCPTSTALLTVFDDGIAPVLTDSVSFASVAALGVLDTLELDGNGGSVEIYGFNNDIAPEPWAFPELAGTLAILVWFGRGRLPRSESIPFRPGEE